MYQIKELSELSGITPRTLRFYEEKGIIKSTRDKSNNYRLYNQQAVDDLQKILFLRELGLSIVDIQTIFKNNNQEKILETQLLKLEQESIRIKKLIKTIQKTISTQKGETTMTDEEKFEAFKKEQVQINEEQYGDEIHEKYGEENVQKANAAMLKMSEDDFTEFQKLEQEITDLLKDPNSDNQLLASKHKQWIEMAWGRTVEPEAHKGLGDMYVSDQRFSDYYLKRAGVGAAQKMRDAIYNLYE